MFFIQLLTFTFTYLLLDITCIVCMFDYFMKYYEGFIVRDELPLMIRSYEQNNALLQSLGL